MDEVVEVLVDKNTVDVGVVEDVVDVVCLEAVVYTDLYTSCKG